jgi:predicted nucleotidyltransferase
MNTPADINRLRLRVVAQLLAGLDQDVVFVGGATVSLYVDSPTAVDVRPTDDVDVVVELATYGSYSDLDTRLRQLGFQNDIISGVICRYQVQGITVDVMPTDPSVLGFSNRWYADGFHNAMLYDLDGMATIQLFTLPYFVASMWEACKGRGGEDLRWSTDFEDIIFVLDQVADAEEQLKQAPEDLRAYFRAEFREMLNRPDIDECIYAHLEPRFATQRSQRISQILTNLIDE